jgi:flavin reductase (DIM6/NTAB) family NADH-FMN oxidoreductase RutF
MPPALTLVTDAQPDAAVAQAPEFADAMSELASGVVVVTCWVGDRPWGMTVTAFASVSADPPTVLVSLDSDGAAARAIASTRRFGVSMLAAEQLSLARYGSAPRATKFLEPFVQLRSGDESPAIAGALAHLDCEVATTIEVADHTVFFGRVRIAHSSPGSVPLVYRHRGYCTLEPLSTRTHTKRRSRCPSS